MKAVKAGRYDFAAAGILMVLCWMELFGDGGQVDVDIRICESCSFVDLVVCKMYGSNIDAKKKARGCKSVLVDEAVVLCCAAVRRVPGSRLLYHCSNTPSTVVFAILTFPRLVPNTQQLNPPTSMVAIV
ncbi:hypothetical protein ACJQWK_06294 [Exserohilum turcicum]